MQELMELLPEAQKTQVIEKPEKKFDREIKRMAIDENHDLVAFGDVHYVPQAQEHKGNLQHEEIELVIINRNSGKNVLRLSDELHAIMPDATLNGVEKNLKIFYWTQGTKTVTVPIDRLFADHRTIFSVLHEIGHAKDDSHKTKEQLRRSEEERSIFMFQDPYNDLGKQSKERIMSEERNAWAYAITIARRIKKEHGIDLFNMFKNADEFMGWLRTEGIRYYEEEMNEPTTKDRAVKAFKKSEKRRNFRKTIEQYPELIQPILYALEANVRSDFIEKTF